MGIGISSFTEVVGAGPSKDYDILGIKMFDSAEIRIHPTGKAMARFGSIGRYAEAIGQTPDRLRKVLRGEAVMQLEDLAAARIHLGVRIGVEA